MNINEFAEEKGIEPRSARALTEVMSVCDFGDGDAYTVVSSSGSEYETTLTDCDCPDATHRDVRCKHSRRLAFELGEAIIPPAIDEDDVDDQLGEHLENADVRFADDREDDSSPQTAVDQRAIADGGQVLGTDESDDTRPDGCDCEPWMAVLEDPIPCWECYREGFRAPNPDAGGDENDE